jgi:transposase
LCLGVSKARLVITAVVVEGRPVAQVAAAYTVSRQWIYKLLARYREEGDQAFQPRSRRPHSQPTAVPTATAELIIRLRGELSGQGLDAGAHTIAWHLAEQHQLSVSEATIWRTLKRAGLITPEPRKKPKAAYICFAAEQPKDVAGRFHPLSAHPTRRHSWRGCRDLVLPGRPLPLRPLGDLPPTSNRPRRGHRIQESRR